MNNEMHGLCSKCIEKIVTEQPQPITYQCQKCNENEAQFIQSDTVVCLQCYLKFKESMSVMKKSQTKNSSFLTLVSKGDTTSGSFTGSFLNKNGKVIKKVQKLLTSYDIKTSAIVQELTKKATLAGSTTQPIQWQKIVDKCHKASGVIYFFVGKELIFGAFHTEPVKIASSTDSSFVEDIESGLFMTERTKYELNIYKASKSIVRYSQKSRSIVFGDPAVFQILFTQKQIAIKSEFQQQLKWQNFFVYKL